MGKPTAYALAILASLVLPAAAAAGAAEGAIRWSDAMLSMLDSRERTASTAAVQPAPEGGRAGAEGSGGRRLPVLPGAGRGAAARGGPDELDAELARIARGRMLACLRKAVGLSFDSGAASLRAAMKGAELVALRSGALEKALRKYGGRARVERLQEELYRLMETVRHAYAADRCAIQALQAIRRTLLECEGRAKPKLARGARPLVAVCRRGGTMAQDMADTAESGISMLDRAFGVVSAMTRRLEKDTAKQWTKPDSELLLRDLPSRGEELRKTLGAIRRSLHSWLDEAERTLEAAAVQRRNLIVLLRTMRPAGRRSPSMEELAGDLESFLAHGRSRVRSLLVKAAVWIRAARRSEWKAARIPPPPLEILRGDYERGGMLAADAAEIGGSAAEPEDLRLIEMLEKRMRSGSAAALASELDGAI